MNKREQSNKINHERKSEKNEHYKKQQIKPLKNSKHTNLNLTTVKEVLYSDTLVIR